ncbi:MAG: hypothetical protein HY537_08065 [Deltaproteobacteria bacterium]|nr:hypothetical protein [Deltaproteobacteria bacterium]
MTVVRVDDRISEINMDPSKTKIGDILDAVASALPANRIITEILLNGTELSKLGGKVVLDNDRENLHDLQIHTADKELWVASGLDIAISNVDRVKRSLIRAAELFRDEKNAEGNHFFARCIDGLERFIEAVTITRFVLRLDFTKQPVEGRTMAAIEQDFSQILKEIISCQEKQNFIDLADRIEYELLPNLSTWTKGLTAMKIARQANS